MVIKRKHIGDALFAELTEDICRYNNSDPFDDQAAPWLETQASQDLRRVLVRAISDWQHEVFHSPVLYAVKFLMAVNMFVPKPNIAERDDQ
jgi:hypothetical protein